MSESLVVNTKPQAHSYSLDEIMTVTAARLLAGHTSCFVGIGLPSAAANLARLTHHPDIALIYESGTIATKPDVLPLSIGDDELADTARVVVSVPEMFRYWLQGGRIDVGFLGAAQIDKFGNINTTVIGDYDSPKVRLPGGGGAPEIATASREVFVMLRQTDRSFVQKLDFMTSVGHFKGGRSREELNITGKGPTVIITDLCVLKPDPETFEFKVASVHPGVTKEQAIAATAWPLKFFDELETTDEPTEKELSVLRDLQARTELAHKGELQ